MEQREILAIEIADKWLTEYKESGKIRKLTEEVGEFIEQVMDKNEFGMINEAGDIIYIIMHILSKNVKHSKFSLEGMLVSAALKLNSRGKEGSIFDRSKRSVNKEKNIFNFKNSLLDLGIEKQIVEDWIKVRKTKKATNSKTAFNSIINQINLSEKTANECIKLAVENSWSGFKAEWLKNNFNENNRTDNKGFKSDTTEAAIQSVKNGFVDYTPET
jgi:NTP pyrophosphatase (non-canonical NTP hydrolase)